MSELRPDAQPPSPTLSPPAPLLWAPAPKLWRFRPRREAGKRSKAALAQPGPPMLGWGGFQGKQPALSHHAFLARATRFQPQNIFLCVWIIDNQSQSKHMRSLQVLCSFVFANQMFFSGTRFLALWASKPNRNVTLSGPFQGKKARFSLEMAQNELQISLANY